MLALRPLAASVTTPALSRPTYGLIQRRSVSSVKVRLQQWFSPDPEKDKKTFTERWRDRMNRTYQWFDEPKHTPIGAGFWWLLTHDVKTFYKWDSALRLTVFSLVLYYVYAAYKNLKFKRSERIPETPQQRMQRHQDERVARKETAALHNTYQNKMLQEWRDGSEDRITKVLQQIKREQELLKEWEIVEVGEDTVDGNVTSIFHLAAFEMILHELFPGIIIGDQEAANACLKRSRLRSKRGVTAILRCNALVEGEVLPEHPEGVAFEYVPLWDDGKDDLLPHIDKAVGFVKYCLDHHGKVLVHCQAGRCRSAAVICAYLMKAWGLDFDLIEGMVHEKEEDIEISENFRRQLRQWGTVYKFDMSLDSEEHRRYWAAKRLAESTAQQQQAEVVEVPDAPVVEEAKPRGFDWRAALIALYRDDVEEDEPEEKVDYLLSKAVNAEEPHVLYLRICRKYGLSFETRPEDVREAILALRPQKVKRRLRCGRCSRTLCGDTNIVHGGRECTSYFIEVMEWMTDVIESANSGAEFVGTQTLLCTCGAKLGSWNWYGLKCSCGKFTAPAMQLHASRVDDMAIRPGEVVSLPKPYYAAE
ncbi:hypothetical protein FOZ63_029840 [Perkinsus olseni]|uniref:protein-tyrosine-phosphatase n=1 Tax=Perkinsus olseni TaxID=32597 RepID=A0A7J6THJ2_PEROL|nr:hypothetical protein FOZ63_029840 [Perkinsus olseni]KAF4750323.1 hypothetical protein FOZ62_009820 [Perkinsus olseni]